jgi:hypothetical protein
MKLRKVARSWIHKFAMPSIGNAGAIIPFRLGLAHVEMLENESAEISALDLISLPNYHIYLKLMVDLKLMVEGKVSGCKLNRSTFPSLDASSVTSFMA